MTFSKIHRVATCCAGFGLMMLAMSCHETPITPELAAVKTHPPLTEDIPGSTDSPASASVSFSISGADPVPSQQQDVGVYPTPTVVSIDVHQAISIESLLPGGGSGFLGLRGRGFGDAGGCSGFGEAALFQFADGFGPIFQGCDLSDPNQTSYSATLSVKGRLQYVWSGDSSCPPPAERCSTYSGQSGITVTRLPATATTSMDDNGGSLTAARYFQGFTFRFNANPAQLGTFATPMQVGMSWTPTGASVPTDRGCDWRVNGGEWVCSLSFDESGTLKFGGVVNGVHFDGGSYAVTVVPPAVTLSASPSTVAPGDTVILTATVVGADASNITSYSFFEDVTGGGGAVSRGGGVSVDKATPKTGTGTSVNAEGEAELPSCRPGVAKCWVTPTKSGVFTVDGVLVRVPFTADAHVTVVSVDSGTVVFDEADAGGGATSTARMETQSSDDATVTAVAARRDDPVVDARPSELVGIAVDSAFGKTLRVRVLDASGQAIPNAVVHLQLHAHEGTGGHEHVRTKLPKDPGLIRQGNGSWSTKLTVNTGASGEAIFDYQSPDAAGPVSLRGTSRHNRPGRIQIDVGYKTLVHLRQITDTLRFVGFRGGHSDPFWVTAKQRRMLYALADTFVKEFRLETVPDTARPLEVNDASLQYGGLLDISGRWTPPHHDHRRGQGTDIRTEDKTVEQTRFLKSYWLGTLHGSIYDETGKPKDPNSQTGPHYHFKECSGKKKDICNR